MGGSHDAESPGGVRNSYFRFSYTLMVAHIQLTKAKDLCSASARVTTLKRTTDSKISKQTSTRLPE